MKKWTGFVLLLVLAGTSFLYWSRTSSALRIPYMVTFGMMSNTNWNSEYKGMCTFDLIKDHINQYTTFMENGKIVGLDKNNTLSKSNVFYKPGFCNLKPNFDNFTWLSTCFEKTNTSKILFVGDSNIRRPLERMLGLLEDSGVFVCNDMHNNTPRGKDGKLSIHKLSTKTDCKWLFRRVYLCGRTTHNEAFPRLVIHYAKMPMLKEPAKFYSDKDNIMCPHVVNYGAQTIQQYIFGDYAQQVNPDIIIIGSTAHVPEFPVSKWRNQQSWLIKQVGSLVARSVPVVWLSQMSWCEKNLGKSGQPKKVEDNGKIYSVNTQVYRQNIEFFRLFKNNVLTNYNNIYPFFDIYNLSSLVRPEWYIDWVHCRPDYYELLMRTFWGVFCNSFFH